MFSKFQVLSLVSLVALPLAVNAVSYCNVQFYNSVSDCSGSPDASCIHDDTVGGYCLWNTWVGSISWSGCNPLEEIEFVACNGAPNTDENAVANRAAVCADQWAIAGPGSGCAEIGTSDGFTYTISTFDPTCFDCVG